MKNLIYISGLSFSSMIWVGSLFKIMHWPGASILLSVGILGVIVVFIPIALFGKNKPETTNKWLNITLFITAFITLLAALFKIMHWPGAGILLLISFFLPFVLFLPVYMYQTLRNNTKSLNKFILVCSFIVYFAVMSSLLAINISYNVLKAGLTILETKQQNIELYNSMLQDDNIRISDESDKLFDEIQKIKVDLILQASSDNADAIDGENINVESLKMIDKKVGIEEEELQKIIAKVDSFIVIIKYEQGIPVESKNVVYELLTTTPDEEFPEDWASVNLYNQPMINTINLLTQMQEGIRFAQIEIY